MSSGFPPQCAKYAPVSPQCAKFQGWRTLGSLMESRYMEDQRVESERTRINDVRVTPHLGGRAMRNREVSRAAQYIWMYVRDNCMNLDAASCTEKISHSMGMVLKECRRGMREARREVARHQKLATADRLKADGLAKEVVLLNKRIKKLEQLEQLEKAPKSKRGRNKGTKKRGWKL